MTVVGTAGHVDHGKSTLLEALTGRDPDRWEEEKRRGLTIDLGFVWTTLPSGRQVSFVDVPGHEKFIKNMLAGIESVDAALFVVAADEGWMPQSEEHLAVLDLLGVDSGVVALTKTDRVEGDLVELATLEVMERLEGTTLAGVPVVAVSAVTGDGLGLLKDELDRALPDPPPATDPRLWIDRRFSVAGAGTVVTGTLLGADLSVGDTLTAYPGETEFRIRGIESHEQAIRRVEPHRRVALNLVGDDTGLDRGTMLGRTGLWTMTDRVTARVRAARYVEALGDRGAYQLHTGTAAVTCRLRMMDGEAIVSLNQSLPLRYGDRFILRETGRRAVVGGGTILDPAPPRRGRELRAATRLPSGLTRTEAADALLALRGSDDVARLVAHTGARPSRGIVGDVAITREELDRLAALAEAAIDGFHAAAPLRPGIPVATLISRLGVPASVTEQVVDSMPSFEIQAGVARRIGRARQLTDEQDSSWAAARRILVEAGLTPPLVAELPIDLETVHELVRRGELVQVAPTLAYLPDQVTDLQRALAAMADGFTVADFRDNLGVSRKYAVPILEWADRQGLTRRQGDRRYPRRDR